VKVLVAISGGVDSAVAAAILKNKKTELIAVHLDLFGRTDEIEMARAITAKLKIPFYVLNFRKEFKQKVIADFLQNYSKNRTPNPCVICNREIKFGKLFHKMRELKCDRLATGHFARTYGGKLFRGSDTTKDQSYFLCRLKKEKLRKIIFPLGNLRKSEIKKMATKMEFKKIVEKKESSGICFLEGTEINDFLRKNLSAKIFRPGKIRTSTGKIVGEHHGLPLYTIGQRRGVALGGMPEPFFVSGFNFAKNELIVAPDQELFGKKLIAKKLSWIDKTPKNGERIWAQSRHRASAEPGQIFLSKTRATFEFTEPVRAITPGQTVVFFRGSICLGGGEIC